MSNVDLDTDLDDIIYFIKESEKNIFRRIDELSTKSMSDDIKKIKEHQKEQQSYYDQNIRKLDDMIKEFKGCLSMARSFLPKWSKIGKDSPKEEGRIIVKDSFGNETEAKYYNSMITLNANTGVNCPEYWRPIKENN